MKMTSRFFFILSICVICALSMLADRPAKDREHSSITKTVELDGKQVRLKSCLTEGSNTLNIALKEGVSLADTNNSVLVRIPTGDLGPCGYDFALSPGGNMLWVFLQKISRFSGQPECIIYPFVRGQKNMTQYVYHTKEKRFGNLSTNVISSFNLTAWLRLLAMSSYSTGKPLALGRNVHIEDVRLHCTNSVAVSVTGKLGTNYTFRGTVVLDKSNDLVANDFAIESVSEKTAADSK